MQEQIYKFISIYFVEWLGPWYCEMERYSRSVTICQILSFASTTMCGGQVITGCEIIDFSHFLFAITSRTWSNFFFFFASFLGVSTSSKDIFGFLFSSSASKFSVLSISSTDSLATVSWSFPYRWSETGDSTGETLKKYINYHNFQHLMFLHLELF